MTAPVQQAIEALEHTAFNEADIVRVLSILRSIPGPATEEEIAAIYNADDDIEAFVTAVKYFRAGEQFTRRRILGE